MTFGSRLLRVAETLLTAFLGHLLVFRFTLPESVLAHAIWMCMAKAPYRSLTIAPTIAPVRPKPSPLCLGRTQFLSVYWLLVYSYCLCVGGPHHGEVTRNVERAPNIWAIKLASSFHSIALCKKELLLCTRSVYTIGCCTRLIQCTLVCLYLCSS